MRSRWQEKYNLSFLTNASFKLLIAVIVIACTAAFVSNLVILSQTILVLLCNHFPPENAFCLSTSHTTILLIFFLLLFNFRWNFSRCKCLPLNAEYPTGDPTGCGKKDGEEEGTLYNGKNYVRLWLESVEMSLAHMFFHLKCSISVD